MPTSTHGLASSSTFVAQDDGTSQEGWNAVNGKKARGKKAAEKKATSTTRRSPNQPTSSGTKAAPAAATTKSTKAAAASGAAASSRQSRPPSRPAAPAAKSTPGFSASHMPQNNVNTAEALVGFRVPLCMLKAKLAAVTQAVVNLVCLETGPDRIRSYRPIRGELAMTSP